MNKLYAPWRNSYVSEDLRKKHSRHENDGCVFCNHLKKNNNAQSFILKRYKHVFVILNHYPYNAGHLMVLPLTHKADLDLLSPDEQSELLHVISLSTQALKKTMKPHGFNIGFNIGAGSGGGIPSHLHAHVLPRWEGDTNFLPTLFETKVVCSDLQELYKTLKPHF